MLIACIYKYSKGRNGVNDRGWLDKRSNTLLAAEFNSDIRANSSLAPFSTVFERVPSRDSGNLTGGIRDEINYLIPVSISLVNNNS